VLVSKENYPAHLLISQKEAHTTTVLDARTKKKKESDERDFPLSQRRNALPTQRYFPEEKKLKLAPSSRQARKASYLFTREFALQFLSAETVETDCACKENISSALM
jgi:hypothetical protein